MIVPVFSASMRLLAERIPSISFNTISIICLFFYTFLMEGISGQTMGKMITRTSVQFEGKNSMWGAFLRSICRLIPFEPFSFLYHKNYGWHDKFTETYVELIEDNPDGIEVKDGLNIHSQTLDDLLIK